jgi:hypothetical protein
VQISFGSEHGWWGEHDAVVHCRATVSKHLPNGSGGGQAGTQRSSAGHGAVAEQVPLHCDVVGSKHVPLGEGGGHCGTQIAPVVPTRAPVAEPHGSSGEHAAPHWAVRGSKHVPLGCGGGHCGTQSSFACWHGASGPHD